MIAGLHAAAGRVRPSAAGEGSVSRLAQRCIATTTLCRCANDVHALSRGVRAEPSTACADHPGPARPTQVRDHRRASARAPRLDDMGATFEAGIQDRHLDLRALWWRGQGHREHRRSERDQENPRSSRAARRGHDPRVQTLRPSAATSTIAGPERARLTADPSVTQGRRDARLA